jgi:hypothetical protein
MSICNYVQLFGPIQKFKEKYSDQAQHLGLINKLKTSVFLFTITRLVSKLATMFGEAYCGYTAAKKYSKLVCWSQNQTMSQEDRGPVYILHTYI